MTSYFILPIHNKEYLLKNVLTGIVNSCDHNFHIIGILDGCTDSSEKELKSFISNNQLETHFSISTMPDVHEIICLNYGLTKIKLMNPSDDDLIFTVQDDVCIEENALDEKFNYLFSKEQNLGYVSMRLGSELVYHKEGTISEQNYTESEFGHWKQLGMTHYQMITRGEFVKKQIAIRSPTCVQWKRYKEIGFYDPALAPCGYDCHDFSVRMLQHGYENGVFAMKFRSDVAWGGMRTTTVSEINKKHGEIYEQNRRYLGLKHRDYFTKSFGNFRCV